MMKTEPFDISTSFGIDPRYGPRTYDLCCNTCDSVRADTCIMNVVLAASQRTTAETAAVLGMGE